MVIVESYGRLLHARSERLACVNRNAERETARQAKLTAYRETGAWPGAKPAKAKPWSEAKAKKQEQKQKKQKRREVKELKKKKRNREVDPDEWDELASEARALKKLKKGKVSGVEGSAPFL